MITTVLAFILSPMGRIAMIALAIVAAVAFIDRRATYRERAKCQAAVIQSKLDAANADLKAEKDARAEDQKAKDDLETQRKTAEAENENLKAEIAKLPLGEQCIVSPERARRMR